ncbi:MAG: hypothetical protein KJO70_11810 [Gammaproteobacteria bacterium]|nr:hypothetical protein [Gammaproteobacteria bacterium]MBT8051877.1 hypothetical protein [Gammaproteobacteria bacterium]
MSLMNSSGTVTTLISGERSRTENTVEPGSKIMRSFAMDDIWSEAGNAALDASADTAAAHASSALGQKTAEALGDSVGGSVAGSAIGAASQKLIGGALGKFRKRKKEEEPEPVADLAAASVNLFTITTELTGVSRDDIPAPQFEVPQGWQRVESASW